VFAGWAAEGAGGHAGEGERLPGAGTGANTSGDGALRGDRACGGAGACNARDDSSGCTGDSSSNSMAGWRSVDGDGGSGGEGGEKHPSIRGICLFLDKTAARMLACVASLKVLTLFLGGGAACGDTIGGGDPLGGGDTIGGGDAGWDGGACTDREVATGAVEAPATLASAIVWFVSFSSLGV
jgi:hypothetical protein